MENIKYFTPAQARQTLPLVKKIVSDILKIGAALKERSLAVGTHAESDPDVMRLLDELEEHFEELESLGCSYKNWNFTTGLVDFPAKIDGREVCLCWRSDEEGLEYYHDLEEGYAGRKPIPAHLK